MHIHNTAFWVIIFFLLGVVGAYYLALLPILIFTLFLSLVFCWVHSKAKAKTLNKFKTLSIISFFIFIGAFYCSAYNLQLKDNSKIIFDKKIEFSGVVKKVNKTDSGQNLFIDLDNPYKGKIQIYTRQYPIYQYGDRIKFNGVIQRPDKNPGYFLKNGLLGTSLYPENKLISKHNGNDLKTTLLVIKNKTVESFHKGLNYEQAALISGIVIGERSDFSKELKDQMSKSGTTHMVALSGYNISVIASTTILLFTFLLSRKKSFLVSVLFIVLFVIMAGAEASVVRAAIMGFIILMARHIGRLYSARNAMAIAAFVMVISNPNLLLFDIGFQLSFMALFGLIYIGAVIGKYVNHEKGPGILGWRENLSQTASAQFGVFPILLSQFGSFPITSVLANILILGFMPLTMGLGFLYAGLSFVSHVLAALVLLPLDAFLDYELLIIKFFGTHYINIEGKITLSWIVIYYAAIFILIYYKNIKKILNERKFFNFQ